MYANPVAGPIMEPVSFERHIYTCLHSEKEAHSKMARFNIDEHKQVKKDTT